MNIKLCYMLTEAVSDLRGSSLMLSVLVFPWYLACTHLGCEEFFTWEKRQLGSGLLDTALLKQILILLMLCEKKKSCIINYVL